MENKAFSKTNIVTFKDVFFLDKTTEENVANVRIL